MIDLIDKFTEFLYHVFWCALYFIGVLICLTLISTACILAFRWGF